MLAALVGLASSVAWLKARPTVAEGPVIARLDCSKGWPACGWDSWTDVASPYYKAVQSGNGTRFTFTPSTRQAQPYLGWLAKFRTDSTELYIRFRLTIHGPFFANGVGDVWTNKLAIVNNGGDPRAIVQLKPFAASDNSDLSLSTNVGISSDGAPGKPLAIGKRHAIQIRVARGDGVTFAQWVDKADCAKPTSVSSKLSFNPSSFENVGLGFYSNASMAANGAVDFTIEDAEIGTSCDPDFR
jgi:hypothetical protein